MNQGYIEEYSEPAGLEQDQLKYVLTSRCSRRSPTLKLYSSQTTSKSPLVGFDGIHG